MSLSDKIMEWLMVAWIFVSIFGILVLVLALAKGVFHG